MHKFERLILYPALFISLFLGFSAYNTDKEVYGSPEIHELIKAKEIQIVDHWGRTAMELTSGPEGQGILRVLGEDDMPAGGGYIEIPRGEIHASHVYSKESLSSPIIISEQISSKDITLINPEERVLIHMGSSEEKAFLHMESPENNSIINLEAQNQQSMVYMPMGILTVHELNSQTIDFEEISLEEVSLQTLHVSDHIYTPNLTIEDGQSGKMAHLGITEETGAYLHLFNEQGEKVVRLLAGRRSGEIILYGPDQQILALMGRTINGDGGIWIFNKDGTVYRYYGHQ